MLHNQVPTSSPSGLTDIQTACDLLEQTHIERSYDVGVGTLHQGRVDGKQVVIFTNSSGASAIIRL